MMKAGDTVAIFEDYRTGKRREGYARFIRMFFMDGGVGGFAYCEVMFKEEDFAVERWIALDKNGDPSYK
jgi:hypothetical protein